MVDQLWAPWRLEYVRGERPSGCPLCAKPSPGDADEALIVARGEHCFAMLNLFPYNPGHLMISPYRHVGDLLELTSEEAAECQSLLHDALRTLRATMKPEGANIGLNLGSAAGAGIPGHLHWHIVPRWNGDTNFMPVLAEIKVMAQHMRTTHEQLRDGFAQHATQGAASDA